MKYRKGERVRHPNKDDWGLGEVLEYSKGETVRVFFVGAGEKTLSLKHVQPHKVVRDESTHPVFENLSIRNTASGIKYQSLPQSIESFLEQFPEGFYGKKFKESERDYKDRAHALARELLGADVFSALLKDEDYDEIRRRALKIVGATNLIFPNEKMSLKDGLKESEALKEFSEVLFYFLHGEGGIKPRFIAFANFLAKIDAAKWTIATYFLFIMHPDRYMFVKPTVTQHSSELCRFEINYKPQLNWPTYRSVLRFSEHLFSGLSELKPRDMIDVQSFMWCVAPGSYKGQ